MDYGKMAYLKTEELEAKLGASVKSSSFSPALYRLRLDEESGVVTVLEVDKKSETAVIAKVEATSGGGVLHLNIGRLRAASGELKSGQGSCIMFGAGSGDIELDFSDISGGAKIISVELLLPGGAAVKRERKSRLKMAVCGDRYAICRVENGGVELIGCDSELGDLTRYKAGMGTHADVCRAGAGFCLVYADGGGRLWSVALSNRLELVSRSLLGDAVGEFSVTTVGDRVYLFFGSDGKVKYFSFAYPSGTRPDESEIDYAGRVDRADAVKDSEPIALVLESGGKLSLLKEETAASANAVFTVTLKGRAENV